MINHKTLSKCGLLTANALIFQVLCVSADDEMGFLLNLPPPCNVILQPSQIGMSGKVPASPFLKAFENFLKGKNLNTHWETPFETLVCFQGMSLT